MIDADIKADKADKTDITDRMKNDYALVFPGQGSQSVGMLADLAQKYSQILTRFEQASAVLGYDLWALAQAGPAEKLAETEVTQPLVLTANLAIWDIWQSISSSPPSVVAGHSLGEYSALVVAESMAFEDALVTVANRAKAMSTAVPAGEGGMLVVMGLSADVLEEICLQASETLSATVGCVNYNAPGQIVVGGHRSTFEVVQRLAKEAGAKRVLPVAMSVPSHSPLMKPAAEKMAAHLESVSMSKPSLPLINNARLSIEWDVGQIKQSLVEQIYLPVNWIELVQGIKRLTINTLAECGPNKVLTGLNKRIDKSLKLYALSSLSGLESACLEIKS